MNEERAVGMGKGIDIAREIFGAPEHAALLDDLKGPAAHRPPRPPGARGESNDLLRLHRLRGWNETAPP